MGEYHRPYSLFGTIRYRVPRDDWCSVERITPTIMSGTEMIFMIFSGVCNWKRSNTVGMNSRNSTVV